MMTAGTAMCLATVLSLLNRMTPEEFRKHVAQWPQGQAEAVLVGAAQAGRAPVVGALLPGVNLTVTHKSDQETTTIGGRMLIDAMRWERADVAVLLLESEKVDLTAKYQDLGVQTTVACAALIGAEKMGRNDAVDQLLWKVNWNAQYNNGQVQTTIGGDALVNAAMSGCLKVVEMLWGHVDARAAYTKGSVQTTVGGEAFIVAVQMGHQEIVKALFGRVDLSAEQGLRYADGRWYEGARSASSEEVRELIRKKMAQEAS